MTARLSAALADRYRIERELGTGGMATVYLARDLKHERDLAVKVLREDLTASIGAGRFLREIKIAAQLQHPHILGLLDSGEADGLLYFVMPYVRGQSLRERLAQAGELPVHEAVRLLLEIVDALSEAHAHGVVHRDIKPDNVMVSGRHVMVMDFGVAKAISEATGSNTITTTGVAVGTPAYMSPEQATADPHVDHRSDIYSVGVIAYEMLTGRPPFVGASPQQVLAAHVTSAPDPVSKQRPGISSALDAVVMRCLEKRPADRFQSAGELHAALEPLATPIGGVTPTETTPHASRSRSRLTIAAVVAGVVLIAAASLKLLSGSSAAAPVTIDRVQFTTSGRAFAPLVSPDGREVVYTEEQCTADSLPCTQRLMLQDVATGARQPITDTLGSITADRWSPTGTWILVFALDGTARPTLFVMSRLGGVRVPVSEAATFTATGDTVLSADGFLHGSRGVHIRTLVPPWTRPVDSIQVMAPEKAMFLVGLDASPNGRWIAAEWDLAGQQSGVLTVQDREGKTASSRPIQVNWVPMRWNATGTVLFRPVPAGTQVGLERSVVARDGKFGTIDTLLLAASSATPRISRSANGSVFAYDEAHGGERSIYALEPPTTGSVMRRSRLLISGAALGAALITPDGSQVVYASATTGAADSRPQFFIVPFAGGVARSVTPPLAGAFTQAITGDSRRLVVAATEANGQTRVSTYDIATGRMVSTSLLAERINTVVTTAAGEIVLASSRIGVFLDDSLRERGRVTIPDSLGGAQAWVGSRRGSGVAVKIQPLDIAATFKEDWNFHFPLFAAASSGTLTAIGTTASWDFFGLWWLADGTLRALLMTGSDPRISVYGTNPTRLLWRLPFHDPLSMDFSADGKRAVAVVRPEVRNVWLVRDFAPAMR